MPCKRFQLIVTEKRFVQQSFWITAVHRYRLSTLNKSELKLEKKHYTTCTVKINYAEIN
jgi:hypothetical protein